MSSTDTVPPPISWAQRKDLLYVNVNVECKDIDYKFTKSSMHFKGVAANDNNKKFEVTLNFLKPINPEKVTVKNIGRCLEFTIFKEVSEPYWASLTNDKKKPPFLKIDFHKWVEQSNSESEAEDNEMNFQKMMDNTNNLFGSGTDKPGFDISDEEDSDDESIPQLSS